jgi:glycosyltransferase involved in cell wall biosynthesis
MSATRTADDLDARTAALADARVGPRVAIVVPAFNEHDGVTRTIGEIRAAMAGASEPFELVVVDDGSDDGTGDRARETGARVIRLPENRGYGAALKAGIAATTADRIVIIDADGTYPPGEIPRLLAAAGGVEMVVGARSAQDTSIPVVRRPAKWVLARLASYLAGEEIPDLNSGLRVMERSVLSKFIHLLPDGFSFTTTITLALLCTSHNVIFEPIECRRRIGTSKIRATDFTSFVMLVLRTVVLFNPLKVFLPLGAALFVAGLLKLVYDVVMWNLSESAVMAFLAAVMVWSVGLLADMISRLHLRPPGHS